MLLQLSQFFPLSTPPPIANPHTFLSTFCGSKVSLGLKTSAYSLPFGVLFVQPYFKGNFSIAFPHHYIHLQNKISPVCILSKWVTKILK